MVLSQLLPAFLGTSLTLAAANPVNGPLHLLRNRASTLNAWERTEQLGSPARLESLAECPVRTTGNVTCANLIVPERRDISTNVSISVPVAVLHATDGDRQPDPLLFLMGGQGQGFSVLDQLAALPSVLKRDVITLEQRGTQLAVPFFGCPGVESGTVGIDQNLVSQASVDSQEEIQRCMNEIVHFGVDKNAYDTVAGADDLWDLRQLLGVDEWNIFGISYGGRTAETCLRKHPESARSLVLDSPMVTGIPVLFGHARLKNVEKFFTMCLNAEGCSSFGNLKAPFERTVGRLESNPVPVVVAGRNQTLTARAYIRIVTWILYNLPESSVHGLPAAIIAADMLQDYAPLLALEHRFSDLPLSSPPRTGGYPSTLGDHLAQQTAMLCAEELPSFIQRTGNFTLPPLHGWSAAVQRVWQQEQNAQAKTCQYWGFEQSDPEQSQVPPLNKLPTLVVHGAHDTITPSEDGDVLAQSFPHSTRVVFPWTGHSVIDRRQGCFFPMLRTFLDFPTNMVETSCATEIQEPTWLRESPQIQKPKGYLSMMQTICVNQVRDFKFPGLTVYLDLPQVNVSGVVVAGYAELGQGDVLTGCEPSRIASMTKTYTAAAVLRLMEAGNVNISSGIGYYLTGETQSILNTGGYDLVNITVQHLLQHTSGLPDYNDKLYQQRVLDDPYYQWSRHEQIKWAIDHSRSAGAPGEVFAYSDTGYNLLGEIIEQVSNVSQASAYRSLLDFERLNIRHTWFEKLESAPADLPARARQFIDSIDGTDFDSSFDLFGGGGLVATSEDAAGFLRALMTGLVFDDEETLDLMLSIPSVSADANYAMGIERLEGEGFHCWGHGGFWGTLFAYCPSANLTLASNRYQSVDPESDYHASQILRTALEINRLALFPAAL